MSSVYDLVFDKENIVHAGAALYLAGFLFREQVLLRCLIVFGDVAYTLYYLYAPETPLWGGVFWSVLFILVNITMIGLILAERTQFALTPEQKTLFGLLGTLSPGQFRKLMKLATLKTAQTPVELTREGVALDELHYVIEGDITISKSSGHTAIDSRSFVGEVAFLLSRPASATATVGAGARYFSWDSSALKALTGRSPDLANALSNAMNRHMAAKVAAAGVPAAMAAAEVVA